MIITNFKLFEGIIDDIDEYYPFINDVNSEYRKYSEHTRKSLNILTPIEFYEKHGSDVLRGYKFLEKKINDPNAIHWVVDYYSKIISFFEEIPEIKIMKSTKEFNI